MGCNVSFLSTLQLTKKKIVCQLALVLYQQKNMLFDEKIKYDLVFLFSVHMKIKIAFIIHDSYRLRALWPRSKWFITKIVQVAKKNDVFTMLFLLFFLYSIALLSTANFTFKIIYHENLANDTQNPIERRRCVKRWWCSLSCSALYVYRKPYTRNINGIRERKKKKTATHSVYDTHSTKADWKLSGGSKISFRFWWNASEASIRQ